MFHEQIHKMSEIVSAQPGTDKEQQDCDGNCGIMKNSQQQDDKSKDQNTQKISLSDLSAHNTSFFYLNTELHTTNYFPEILTFKYSALFPIESPPPRFS